MNLYAYTRNDPVNNTDPSGMVCLPCIGAVVGGGIELVSQLSTSQGRAAYSQAVSALAGGDFSGALDAAGANLAKVGVAAAAGAVGGASAQTLTRAATTVTAVIGAEVSVGAATGAVVGGVNTAIDGGNIQDVAIGAAFGAAGGAAGAGAGMLAGNAVGQRAAQNVLRNNNSNTVGGQAFARGQAAEVRQRNATTAATITGAVIAGGVTETSKNICNSKDSSEGC